MKVEWLNPLAERATKANRKLAAAMGMDLKRLPDCDYEGEMAKSGDVISKRTVAMDRLIARDGVGLALKPDLVNRIKSFRIDGAVDRGSWHLPWKCLSLGFPSGAGLPPARIVYAPYGEIAAEIHEMNGKLKYWGDDDDMFLAVFIGSIEAPDPRFPSVDFPAVCSAFLSPEQIKTYIQTRELHSTIDHPDSQLDDQEMRKLYEVTQFVIGLGIYMSLEGAEATRMVPTVKWAPRVPLKRIYLLTDKVPFAEGLAGKSMHLVSEYVRQLRDDRYYQGKWEYWPKGTRYVLVKSHFRNR